MITITVVIVVSFNERAGQGLLNKCIRVFSSALETNGKY